VVAGPPSEANEDNLSDVRREASRYFRNKEREYLKVKINELEPNSKNKNIRDLYRDINGFKKGYQPRTYLVKDERGDLLADPHKISNRWKNYFCQLLNVHGAGGVRQIEMHTAEPFVPDPSASEVEAAIGRQKWFKSPNVDQVELVQTGVEKLLSEIHKLIKFIWNSGKSQLWYLFTKRVIKLSIVIIEAIHCCQLHTKFYQTFSSLG
jgi:hypothetical protein